MIPAVDGINFHPVDMVNIHNLQGFIHSRLVSHQLWRLQSLSAVPPPSPFPLFLSTLWPRHRPPFFRQGWATRLKLADFLCYPRICFLICFPLKLLVEKKHWQHFLVSKWWQRLPGINYPIWSLHDLSILRSITLTAGGCESHGLNHETTKNPGWFSGFQRSIHDRCWCWKFHLIKGISPHVVVGGWISHGDFTYWKWEFSTFNPLSSLTWHWKIPHFSIGNTYIFIHGGCSSQSS